MGKYPNLPSYGIPICNLNFSVIGESDIIQQNETTFRICGMSIRELVVSGREQFERRVANLLLEDLKAQGKYNPLLLYRCFSPERLEHVVMDGTDRSSDSFNWDGSKFPEDFKLHLSSEDLLIHTLGTRGPRRYPERTCISVYDSNQMVPLDAYRGLYTFRDKGKRKSALLQVFNLLITEYFEERFNLFDD